MSLQSKLIDRLWGTEYGDFLDLPHPGSPNPTNIRSGSDGPYEIRVNQYLTEGLYHLEGPIPQQTTRGLDMCQFNPVQNLGIVQHKLKTLTEVGKPLTTYRTIKVDANQLTDHQRTLLEDLFRHPVFNEGWNVNISASRTQTENDYRLNVVDFNKCFVLTKPSEDDYKEDEEPAKDVYLVLLNGERGYVSFNLSLLIQNRIIEIDEVMELMNAVLHHQAVKVRLVERAYSYATHQATSTDVENARAKMKHDNLVEHLAKTLVKHNPNTQIRGHGEDYINYHVSEETGEFPYVVEYHAPLWRLSVPGLTEAVVGNSMNKNEALRMITDGFTLETKINPLSEDDIYRLQNQYYIRGMDNVEWGRFTYSVKRDKR